MRRVLPWIVLVLLGLLTLHPLIFYGVSDGASEVDEPTRITRYDAAFDVDDYGTMAVTETITVDFPEGEERRGIFRFFDEVDPQAEHTRRIPQATKVSRDGADEPHEWSTENGGRIHALRIGDEATIIEPGLHTYVLSYRMDRVLVEGTQSAARFHWDLIPGGWSQPIDEAKLSVTLPSPPQDLVCGVGDQGARDCTATLAGDSTVIVETSRLEPRQRVTLRAELAGVQPSAAEMPWSPAVARVLGADPEYTAFVVAGVVFAGGLGRWLARKTIEGPVRAPIQYTPPAGVGPHQALFVSRERIPKEAFVAALMHAAERGAITLHAQGNEGRDWEIRGTGHEVDLDEITRSLLQHLGVQGAGTFVVRHKGESAGRRIEAATTAIAAETRQWALGNGMLAKSGPGVLGAVGVLAAFALYAVLVFLGLPSTSLAMVPGAFAALGLPLLFAGATTVRTAAGRDLWGRVTGFERSFATPTGQSRVEHSGRPDLYVANVPWAVAFGRAQEWESTYRTWTGHAAPQVAYLYGFTGAGAGVGTGLAVASIADSFNSAVSSAVSAYQSEQSSSSSSGSSGGGGGGGGGGSW